MILYYSLYAAFGLWLLQQGNDAYNAFRNRKEVPKMFWLSAGASFASGLFLFYFLYDFLDTVGDIFVNILNRI